MTGIDDYLAPLPEDQRKALQRLREMIGSTVPGVEETIAWEMPAFKYRGSSLVGFAAFKDHLSFFPMSTTVMKSHKDELESFKTTKGTIHFTPEKPIPAALVKKLVRERIKENEQKTKRTKPSPKRPRHPMPGYVKHALEGRNLVDAYKRRPPYQRNDYIGWIAGAKQEITRQKRLDQMLDELERGDVYMKMEYKPRNGKPPAR